MRIDPLGLWWFGDPLPQWLVDGAAGFGDGIIEAGSFGMLDGNSIRRSMEIDGGVDPCSGIYQASSFIGSTVSPNPAGKVAAVGKISKLGKKVSKTTKPDFIVSRSGTVFPVPKGATGPTPVFNPAGKKTGSAFTGGTGGANSQVYTMRIMNPTPPRGNSPGYPNGYIKYENKTGQGVDPYTGRTLSNKDSHFPIE